MKGIKAEGKSISYRLTNENIVEISGINIHMINHSSGTDPLFSLSSTLDDTIVKEPEHI